MELSSMPTEIHLNLQVFLDHSSLLNLSATNKHFRSLCTEQQVKESLLCEERCSLVTETVLTRNSLLPCYICFKARNSFHHFPKLSANEDPRLASGDASTRVCATCMIVTRPDLIFKLGAATPGNGWIFHENHLSRSKESRMFGSRYDRHDSQGSWLMCAKCDLVKRYMGSPYGRQRRYDEALRVGDMCATCYQPVWDQENAERRERKNALSRQRYRERKEAAKKQKEAAENSGQTVEQETASSAAAGTVDSAAAGPWGMQPFHDPNMGVPTWNQPVLPGPGFDQPFWPASDLDLFFAMGDPSFA